MKRIGCLERLTIIQARQRRGTPIRWGSLTAGAVLGVLAVPVSAVGPNTWPYVQQVYIGVHDHATKLLGGSGKEDGVDISLETRFRTPPGRFWETIGSPRPHLGVQLNAGDDTDQVYSGLSYRWWPIDRQWLDFSAGAAVHNGKLETEREDKRALGRRVLFRAALEYGYQITDEHGVSVIYNHISNGFRSGSNDGLDSVGLRYSYSLLEPEISDGALIESQLQGGPTDTATRGSELTYEQIDEADAAPPSIQSPTIYLDERVQQPQSRQRGSFTIY